MNATLPAGWPSQPARTVSRTTATPVTITPMTKLYDRKARP